MSLALGGGGSKIGLTEIHARLQKILKREFSERLDEQSISKFDDEVLSDLE